MLSRYLHILPDKSNISHNTHGNFYNGWNLKGYSSGSILSGRAAGTIWKCVCFHRQWGWRDTNCLPKSIRLRQAVTVIVGQVVTYVCVWFMNYFVFIIVLLYKLLLYEISHIGLIYFKLACRYVVCFFKITFHAILIAANKCGPLSYCYYFLYIFNYLINISVKIENFYNNKIKLKVNKYEYIR